jgi:hypothetical protein
MREQGLINFETARKKDAADKVVGTPEEPLFVMGP